MAREKSCIFCESRTEGIIFGIQKQYVCLDCVKKIEQVCIENLIPVFIKQGAYTDPEIIAQILLKHAEFITGQSISHLLELQKKVSRGELKHSYHISHYIHIMRDFTCKVIRDKDFSRAIPVIYNAFRSARNILIDEHQNENFESSPFHRN